MPQRKVVSRTRHIDPDKVGKKMSAHREHAGTVEAEWKCSSCGTKNPGFTKVCMNCGHPKGSDETYQAPDLRTAKKLSPKELAEAGVDGHHGDQQCAHCGGFSKPGTAICPNCGASLEDVARTSRKCGNCGTETNLVACPQCGVETDPKRSTILASLPTAIPKKMEKLDFSIEDLSKAKGMWFIPLLLVALALVVWLLMPRTATAYVTQAAWNCSISLEEYQYNPHEGWEPMGDVTRTESKIHHYNTIVDGYKEVCEDRYEIVGYQDVPTTVQECDYVYSHSETVCYDDGSCETTDYSDYVCENVPGTKSEPVYDYVEYCDEVAITHDEPVYQTYYYFNVWEWVSINPAVTSGFGFEPYWSENYTIDDKHRETGRNQEFTITLVTRDEEKTFTYTPDTIEEYRMFQLGTAWKVKHSGGLIIEIESTE